MMEHFEELQTGRKEIESSVRSEDNYIILFICPTKTWRESIADHLP